MLYTFVSVIYLSSKCELNYLKKIISVEYNFKGCRSDAEIVLGIFNDIQIFYRISINPASIHPAKYMHYFALLNPCLKVSDRIGIYFVWY